MKTFSDNNITIINEAKKKEPVSNDFSVIKSPDWHTDVVKGYLKALDARVDELNLDVNQCHEAAKLFKAGNFEKALKKIWGSKLKVSETNSSDGYTTTVTYDVSGYATFTEQYVYTGLGTYKHEITGHYLNIDNPSYMLAKPLFVYEKRKQSDFISQINKANKETFMSIPRAWIYNILFVGFDGRDLCSSLSKYHMTVNNKL